MQPQLAIIGSRAYPHLDIVRQFVADRDQQTIIVSGGALGVDAAAIGAAIEFGRPYVVWPVPGWEWRKSRGAGLARTRTLLAHVQGVAAFHDGSSTGTAYTIRLAQHLRLWLAVFDAAGARQI